MTDTYRLSQENPMFGEGEEPEASPYSAGSHSQQKTESPPPTPVPWQKEILPPRKVPKRLPRSAAVDCLQGSLLLLIVAGLATQAFLQWPVAQPLLQTFSPDTVALASWQLNGSDWHSLRGIMGISLRDYLLSGFLFAVGFSLTWQDLRQERQQTPWFKRFRQMLCWSLLLIVLGIFVQSLSTEHTRWVLIDPLTQIGLASLFYFPFLRAARWSQLLLIIVLLAGHTLWFAVAQVPEYGVALQAIPFEESFTAKPLPPQFSAWNSTQNIADYTDRLWLSKMSHQPDALYRQAGRNTFNCLPAVALMLTGGLAARQVASRKKQPGKLSLELFGLGLLLVLAGSGLNATLCPAIERLMTAAWVLLASGYSLLALAFCLLLTQSSLGKSLTAPLQRAGQHVLLLYLLSLAGAGWLGLEILKHATSIAVELTGMTWLPVSALLIAVLSPLVAILAVANFLPRQD